MVATVLKRSFGKRVANVSIKKTAVSITKDQLEQITKDNTKGAFQRTAKQEIANAVKATEDALKKPVKVETFEDLFDLLAQKDPNGHDTLMVGFYTGDSGFSDLWPLIQKAITDMFVELKIKEADAAEAAKKIVEKLKTDIEKVKPPENATVQGISKVLEYGFGASEFGKGNGSLRWVGPLGDANFRKTHSSRVIYN